MCGRHGDHLGMMPVSRLLDELTEPILWALSHTWVPQLCRRLAWWANPILSLEPGESISLLIVRDKNPNGYCDHLPKVDLGKDLGA